MNTSRHFASLLVTGALAVTAFAQSGSSAPGSASPGSTPQTDRKSPSVTTDATTRSTTTTPSSTDTTTPAATPVSPDSSSTTLTTPAAAVNSSNANANAELNATAGFYGPGASQFKNIDTDADGRISRAEFTTSASTAASLTLDTNHDGTVSTEERAAGTKGEKKHWWSRSDKAAGDMDPTETFTKLDADNDGFLSQSELASAHAKLKK